LAAIAAVIIALLSVADVIAKAISHILLPHALGGDGRVFALTVLALIGPHVILVVAAIAAVIIALLSVAFVIAKAISHFSLPHALVVIGIGGDNSGIGVFALTFLADEFPIGVRVCLAAIAAIIIALFSVAYVIAIAISQT